MFERLGPDSGLDEARAAVDLAVTLWNAHVEASKLWTKPRLKVLNKLRRKMRSKQAPAGDANLFDVLSARWLQKFMLDPRLVASWSYDASQTRARHLVCEMRLPDGVEAERRPPVERRIAIGRSFLDEVRIRLGQSSYRPFPEEHHRAVLHDDGSATIHTMMPATVQLFAEDACRASPENPSKSQSADARSVTWCSLRCAAAAQVRATRRRCSFLHPASAPHVRCVQAFGGGFG
jgi:hypothetical protein